MQKIKEYLCKMLDEGCARLIISNPVSKQQEYKKITAEKKKTGYQISKYTEKQVFHENLSFSDTAEKCAALVHGAFKQVNGFSEEKEHILLISKKGECRYTVKGGSGKKVDTDHNRQKNYILAEGVSVPPLVDMGVFTKDGKVINSMYRKYKQINRFLETVDDEISGFKADTLNVIDFGCGKSYLTFVLYYYLTEIKGIKVNMVGLDLKKDVIEKCNLASQKYGYDGLCFELGDINGYKAPFEVDMVVTLHACDTATDFALYNAVNWGARMIFSVPCCQHELNGQIKPASLDILSRYGIIQERFCALATDAVRGNILEYCGYKTQIMEFIDLDHTPKNILIRAVKRPSTPEKTKKKALEEINALINQFGFEPTLYKLLIRKNDTV
ncbi:MAG: SAM-dependent methyltransferase [Clostridia bacterium]|nr:SAM-dependent methyltransferase [Clostridia bacterium]